MVVTALAVAGLVASIGSPAIADPASTSAICNVTADTVMGASETVIGVRVQAFDCSGNALAFHGIVTVAPIDDVNASPWTYGTSAAPAAVASEDGSSAIGLVDIGALPTGFGRVMYDLTAEGDASAFVEPTYDSNNSVLLTRDPGWASTTWTDLTHTGTPVAYTFMQHERDLWGCDTVLNIDAACVLSTDTSRDQTWQKGYKLTLTWPDPGLDSSGRPYQRCRVRSGVVLTATMPGPNGSPSSTAFPVAIDVPASWTSYTLPLGDDIRFPSWVTPGSSTLDVSYWCYSNRGTGTDWTGLKTVDRVLVPDLPPTEPTSIDVTAADGGLVATPGGSVALGAAPLQGYDVALVDEGGTTLDTETVPASTVTPMRVTTSSVVAASAAGRKFSNLEPGRYTVRVNAFNSVGASDAVTSSVVTVSAATPSPSPTKSTSPAPVQIAPAKLRVTGPREVKSRGVHGRVVLSWSKPASAGTGVVAYRIVVHRGKHLVQRASLKPSHRSFTTKRLAAKATYRVTVTVVTKDGRTSSVSRTVRR